MGPPIKHQRVVTSQACYYYEWLLGIIFWSLRIDPDFDPERFTIGPTCGLIGPIACLSL